MDLVDETVIYAEEVSDFSGTFNAAVNEALVTWVNSDEMRLSGIDWQDKINIRKQQLSSFICIGFQLL